MYNCSVMQVMDWLNDPGLEKKHDQKVGGKDIGEEVCH